jgi:hypothetical protein
MASDDFIIGDLRDQQLCNRLFDRRFDEIYQLAADMGVLGTFLRENTMQM